MANCSEKSLPVRLYSAVTARKVEWLWYPYIPYGKITMIQGDPGDGKTTLALNIAALLSNGYPMPDSNKQSEKHLTIYQSAEDSVEDTIKPRLISAGADCSLIAFVDESEQRLVLDDKRIEAVIKEINARLMIIDPLQAYLGDNGDMSRVDGIRPMMKHLAAVAERTGCALVIIGHMNKNNGTKGIYRGLGSIDITAAVRSVLLVGRIKSNPSVRVMAQLKNSLAEEGKAVAFEIQDNSSVKWIGEYDITAEELLNGDAPNDDMSKLSEAIFVLSDLLRNGAMPCTQIYSYMKSRGISKRSVERAKQNLNVKSDKHTDGWYWSFKEGQA